MADNAKKTRREKDTQEISEWLGGPGAYVLAVLCLVFIGVFIFSLF